MKNSYIKRDIKSTYHNQIDCWNKVRRDDIYETEVTVKEHHALGGLIKWWTKEKEVKTHKVKYETVKV